MRVRDKNCSQKCNLKTLRIESQFGINSCKNEDLT
jgi:hypothetical protein